MLRTVFNMQRFKSKIRWTTVTVRWQSDTIEHRTFTDEELIKERISARDKLIDQNEMRSKIIAADRVQSNLSNRSYSQYNTSTNLNFQSTTDGIGFNPIDEQHSSPDITLTHFLNSIAPRLENLKPEEIGLIFDAIARLNFKARTVRHSTSQTIGHLEFCEILKTSRTFKQLLDQADSLGSMLNVDCLVSMYRVLSLINYDPSSRYALNILGQIKFKAAELSLKQISQILISFRHYSKNPFFKDQKYLESSLYRQAATKIASEDFKEDPDSLIFYFDTLGSSQPCFEKLNVWLQELIPQFDYRQLINLVDAMKRINYSRIDLYSIVKLCNKRINDFLSDDRNFRNAKYYISRLHHNIDSYFTYSHLYDEQLLQLLMPCIKKMSLLDNAFYLAYNFARCSVFDQELIKMLYDQLFINPEFAYSKNISKFLFFTKYRFSFVNSSYLAGVMFRDEMRHSKLNNNKRLCLRLLCDLILLDVTNESIILYFNRLSGPLDRKELKDLNFNELKTMSLTRVYLKSFSSLSGNVRSKLDNKLKIIQEKASQLENRPIIDSENERIDSRLQRVVYMSNGLILERIGIYDKSIDDLIPLTEEHSMYFHKIDQLPLSSEQQLLAFVTKFRMRGNIENVETNFDYQLRRVLNKFNIKLIEVFEDEVHNIPRQNRAAVWIAAAKENCSHIQAIE